jgi:tRNA modification GTPase
LEFANRSELVSTAKNIYIRVTALAHSFETGQALKNGVPVAIVGKTNVGKSTLLNALLKDDRAIVSDIHGTTRDTIEDTIDIQGVTFRFIDTAGIRQTNDEVEMIGIRRTYSTIEKAQIILWIFDTNPTREEIEEIIEQTKYKSLIIIKNKIDIVLQRNECLPPVSEVENIPIIEISAKQGINIDKLEQAIFESANISQLSEQDIIVSSARQYQSLVRAHENLSRVLSGLESGLSADLISEDLRLVLDDLADITGQGRIVPNEVLGNIFKNFCVGK